MRAGILQFSPYKDWENDNNKVVNIIISKDKDYILRIRELALASDKYEDIEPDVCIPNNDTFYGIILYEYYDTMEVINYERFTSITSEIVFRKYVYDIDTIDEDPDDFWKTYNMCER